MSLAVRVMMVIAGTLLVACGSAVRPDGASVEAPIAGVMVQHGHREPVVWTALDEGGATLASLDEAGELCIWDKAGRIQARIAGPGGEGSSLAVSPDGSHVAVAWRDVLSFTQRVAVYRVGQLERETGGFTRIQPVQVLLAGVPQTVTALAWNPAGTALVAAAADAVRLWQAGASAFQTLAIEAWPARETVAVALSGSGSILLADRTGSVHLVLPGEKRQARLVSQGMGAVSALAFGHDGGILVGHVSGRLRTLAPGGGQPQDSVLPGRISAFVRRGMTRDIVLLEGRRIAVHAAGGERRFERVAPAGFREDQAVAVRGDGSVSVGYADGGLGLWHPDGTRIMVPPQSPGLSALSVSSKGELVVGTSAGRLITLGRQLERIRWAPAHDGRVCSLAWRPDGDLLLSTGYEGRVSLWNRFGNLLRTGTVHREAANQGAWSRDGQRYATAGTWDKSIRIANINGFEEAGLRGHFEAVMAVAFAPSGRILASAANDSTIRLWTRGAGPAVWTERTVERMSGVETLAWNDSGDELLAAGFDGVRRIRIADGSVENLASGQRASGAVFAEGVVYAAMRSGDIVRWPDGKRWHIPLVTLTAIADAASLVQGRPGRLIVAGTREGRIVLLDTARGEMLFVQVFADGNVLAWDGSGAWDGDPVLAGERLSRVMPGASSQPGLAARFMEGLRKGE